MNPHMCILLVRCSDADISGYAFISTNSATSAGGVGLYIADKIDFIRRRNLELPGDKVESCWTMKLGVKN